LLVIPNIRSEKVILIPQLTIIKMPATWSENYNTPVN